MNWYKKAQTTDDFTNLGLQQRSKPENAMIDATGFHSGIWSYLLEHVGDLTHRMTEHINNGGGYGASKPKIDRAYNYLSHGYFGRDFTQAHEENIVNNSKIRGVPEEEYRKKIEEFGEKYAQEHEALPVYNEAQRIARDAAVALGRFDFDKALNNITWLKNLSDQGREIWDMKVLEGMRSNISFNEGDNELV